MPDFSPTTHTMVLLGRDCGDAMVARLLSGVEPYLYETPLGLAPVGSVWKTGENRSNFSILPTKYCKTLCTKVFSCTPCSNVNEPNFELTNPPPTGVPAAASEASVMTIVSGCLPRPHDPIVGLSHAECTPSVKNTSLCMLHSEYNDIRVYNISVPSDPCMHVLCTSIEPRLTTPLYVRSVWLLIAGQEPLS